MCDINYKCSTSCSISVPKRDLNNHLGVPLYTVFHVGVYLIFSCVFFLIKLVSIVVSIFGLIV